VLFAHNFEEKQRMSNPIKNFTFHMEKYANLNVTYDNFSNYNIILSWKMLEGICLDHKAYNPHGSWEFYFTSLELKPEKKRKRL
jgi:hypothetical protein